jgi:putative DNA primase/helicase
LQLISADGQKKFLSGGKMQGCYFPIGDIAKAHTILIAEGYATAATLYEANNLPTVVAFNAGNLVHVGKSIREQYPTASIIICADDDIKTVGNPGLTKATEAAELVGGKVITPYFGNDRPDGMTDFNDMAALLGIEAVAARFINRSLDLGYRMPVIPQMRPPIRPRINPGI